MKYNHFVEGLGEFNSQAIRNRYIIRKVKKGIEKLILSGFTAAAVTTACGPESTPPNPENETPNYEVEETPEIVENVTPESTPLPELPEVEIPVVTSDEMDATVGELTDEDVDDVNLKLSNSEKEASSVYEKVGILPIDMEVEVDGKKVEIEALVLLATGKAEGAEGPDERVIVFYTAGELEYKVELFKIEDENGKIGWWSYEGTEEDGYIIKVIEYDGQTGLYFGLPDMVSYDLGFVTDQEAGAMAYVKFSSDYEPKAFRASKDGVEVIPNEVPLSEQIRKAPVNFIVDEGIKAQIIEQTGAEMDICWSSTYSSDNQEKAERAYKKALEKSIALRYGYEGDMEDQTAIVEYLNGLENVNLNEVNFHFLSEEVNTEELEYLDHSYSRETGMARFAVSYNEETGVLDVYSVDKYFSSSFRGVFEVALAYISLNGEYPYYLTGTEVSPEFNEMLGVFGRYFYTGVDNNNIPSTSLLWACPPAR